MKDLYVEIHYIDMISEEHKKNKKMVLMVEPPLDYYEEKRDMGIEGRGAVRLLFLRNFNNWIKSTLIRNYCPFASSVLDIGCGKGGDLLKWKLARAAHYVGMDISEHAVNNAVDRFKQYEKHRIFPAIFVKRFDASDDIIDMKTFLPPKVLFDVVSCQFSMHYFFKSEQNVKNFLTHVTARLVPGGHFIGTIPDANVLVKKLRFSRIHRDDSGKQYMFTFGNSFYRASFSQKRFQLSEPFGIKYYFYLEDSVGHIEDGTIISVPEYLIIFEKFKELASQFDLELVEAKNFHDYYKEQIVHKMHRGIFHKIVHKKSCDNEKTLLEQWDLAHLYMIFAFRKKGQKNTETCGNCGSKEHLTVLNATGWT